MLNINNVKSLLSHQFKKWLWDLQPTNPTTHEINRHATWTTLHRRYNGRDRVSNHGLHDCLHKRLFRCWSKKTSKFRFTGIWAGNSPVTGEFPAQRASNEENVSIWWRYHELSHLKAQTQMWAMLRGWQPKLNYAQSIPCQRFNKPHSLDNWVCNTSRATGGSKRVLPLS